MGDLSRSEICGEVVEMIKTKKGSDAEIDIAENKGYSVIKFFGIHSLRVKVGRKNYILFTNSLEHIWINFEFIKVERLKSERLWSRVLFQTREELESMYPLFLQLYDEALNLLNVELFSCCSRFIQCSDEKDCVQPDKRLALGCQYRKNLKNERIFYGESRNLEL